MIKRPKIMVNLFVFNSDSSKILVGKRFYDGSYSTFIDRLKYGEGFDDCASRILSKAANILIEDYSRLNFMCTYNVVNNWTNTHFISIDYYTQLTKKEEKFDLLIDPWHFEFWDWYSVEEVIEMNDILFCGLKTFIKKFKIKSNNDIKNLISN